MQEGSTDFPIVGLIALVLVRIVWGAFWPCTSMVTEFKVLLALLSAVIAAWAAYQFYCLVTAFWDVLRH